MTRRILLARALILALTVVLVPLTARAQGWIELSPRIPDAGPSVPRPAPTQVRRVATNIRATIEGRVARIEVEEQFRNEGQGIAEGAYHYPLVGEAVFQSLSLWMGETEMRGELMDAARARSEW